MSDIFKRKLEWESDLWGFSPAKNQRRSNRFPSACPWKWARKLESCSKSSRQSVINVLIEKMRGQMFFLALVICPLITLLPPLRDLRFHSLGSWVRKRSEARDMHFLNASCVRIKDVELGLTEGRRYVFPVSPGLLACSLSQGNKSLGENSGEGWETVLLAKGAPCQRNHSKKYVS